jgi:hypothetical protein
LKSRPVRRKASAEEKELASLTRKLGKVRAVDVTGIVGGEGVSFRSHGRNSRWTLVLAFRAWRIGGGDVRQRTLTLLKVESRSKVFKLMRRVHPYAIVRVQARLGERAAANGGYGLLERSGATRARDAELARMVKDLKGPARFKDELLGVFTRGRGGLSFEGKARWMGVPVRVTLEAAEGAEAQRAAAAARRLWTAQRTWNRRVVGFATSELLPEYNKVWRVETDDPVMGKLDFARKNRIESIGVSPDGEFTFWFGSADMFGGHGIAVQGSLAKGPMETDLVG